MATNDKDLDKKDEAEEEESDEVEDDESEDDEDEGEGEDDKGKKDDKSEKPEKSKRTPAEELAYLEGRAARLRKKLGKGNSEDGKPAAEKPTTEPAQLDYGQKAFLKSSNISGADEFALVREYMATGKTLDDIVDNKHFKNDLEDLREKRATREAKPKGANRSSQSGPGSVQHWLDKGGLPPATSENQKLRREIVAARAKRGTTGGNFYNSDK